MAVLRDRPYTQFNFLVDLGTGNTEGPEAGFQECSAIGMSVDVAEYRNGNEKENSVRKITGLNKATDVTLKRGVVGSLNLYQWLDQIRNGDQNAIRNVTIQLQNEDRLASLRIHGVCLAVWLYAPHACDVTRSSARPEWRRRPSSIYRIHSPAVSTSSVSRSFTLRRLRQSLISADFSQICPP